MKAIRDYNVTLLCMELWKLFWVVANIVVAADCYASVATPQIATRYEYARRAV